MFAASLRKEEEEEEERARSEKKVCLKKLNSEVIVYILESFF